MITPLSLHHRPFHAPQQFHYIHYGAASTLMPQATAILISPEVVSRVSGPNSCIEVDHNG
jgi:hypothetical protein